MKTEPPKKRFSLSELSSQIRWSRREFIVRSSAAAILVSSRAAPAITGDLKARDTGQKARAALIRKHYRSPERNVRIPIAEIQRHIDEIEFSRNVYPYLSTDPIEQRRVRGERSRLIRQRNAELEKALDYYIKQYPLELIGDAASAALKGVNLTVRYIINEKAGEIAEEGISKPSSLSSDADKPHFVTNDTIVISITAEDIKRILEDEKSEKLEKSRLQESLKEEQKESGETESESKNTEIRELDLSDRFNRDLAVK